MTEAKLAIIPVQEGRRAERRIVNLAARLRDPGSMLIEVAVLDLSIHGFMARCVELEVGSDVWLKMPGLEPQRCEVVWAKDGKAGFKFCNPLHPATVDLIVLNNRKPPLKNYFGPLGVR